MKIKRIISACIIVMLLLALVAVPVFASESETLSVTESETDIKDSPDYNMTKGSLYDWVYTFWYRILGDSFSTADKVCCLLSVITIVAGMIVVFKKFVK